MCSLLPLTKGHLSNVATFYWQKGGLIGEGLLYICMLKAYKLFLDIFSLGLI